MIGVSFGIVFILLLDFDWQLCWFVNDDILKYPDSDHKMKNN